MRDDPFSKGSPSIVKMDLSPEAQSTVRNFTNCYRVVIDFLVLICYIYYVELYSELLRR